MPPPPLGALPTTTFHTFSISTGSKKHAFSFSTLAAIFNPATRRFRIRPSLMALFMLLILAVFCILHQHLNDSALAFSKSPESPPHPFVNHLPHRTLRPPRLPQIKLSTEEELAATISFMAALASNSLPDSIDPSSPIDPDLILEFDTRSLKASNELKQVVEETWTRLPVVLLSKRYSPIGREIKAILSEYNLKPSPSVFDIDERADEAVMTPILHRLTATNALPVLLVAGQPIGSIEIIRELHNLGKLRQMVADSGAVIGSSGKRKKGKRVV
ncbi:hypothetical protein BU17DRAFT_46798 [Hysterangium stoloniferum]|nr:hypothetical protein BU17DRAFT_46798 [Hysterangium stoloniferum]